MIVVLMCMIKTAWYVIVEHFNPSSLTAFVYIFFSFL
jgi:hypothetical protein